jgi:hypothetical protein
VGARELANIELPFMTLQIRHAVFLLLPLAGCSGLDSAATYSTAEAVSRQVRMGMTVPEIVAVAAAHRQTFKILGTCGPKGALNVGGDGGDRGLWAARGSPSGGDGSPQYNFDTRERLRVALETALLSDGSCSSLSVGFPGWASWRFHVALDANGRASHIGPVERW